MKLKIVPNLDTIFLFFDVFQKKKTIKESHFKSVHGVYLLILALF